MTTYFTYSENGPVYVPNGNTHILPRNNLSYYLSNGLFEENLIEWSRQFCSRDKLTLDIGAHTGTYALKLAQCSDRVIAFEPQRMTYYALCGSVALSGIYNIDCINMALSNCDGQETTLNIISEDGGGSTLSSVSPDKVIGNESVLVGTLDCYMEKKRITTPVGFMKIDVEGHEYRVLLGAIEMIRRDKPVILFEQNGELDENIVDLLGGYEILKVRGYSNMWLASPIVDNKNGI